MDANVSVLDCCLVLGEDFMCLFCVDGVFVKAFCRDEQKKKTRNPWHVELEEENN